MPRIERNVRTEQTAIVAIYVLRSMMSSPASSCAHTTELVALTDGAWSSMRLSSSLELGDRVRSSVSSRIPVSLVAARFIQYPAVLYTTNA